LNDVSPDVRTTDSAERHPDWERIADGRPWRLKQGRDFDYSVKRLRVEAAVAAKRLSKVVTNTKDAADPSRYIWLQFADALVLEGRPCPRCGGDRLEQMSGQFVRCPSCGASLIVRRLPSVEDVKLQLEQDALTSDQASENLSTYRDVHLSIAESDPTVERLIGYGFDEDGRFTLLFVIVPLASGRRMPDPSSPTGFVHTVRASVVEPFGDLVDLSALRDVQLEGWDVAV
jgi:DNA-directed RNA polymerase subunit RPC12/RpoP